MLCLCGLLIFPTIAAFILFSFYAGILAIIFGAIAKKRFKKNPEFEGEVIAKLGLVLGIINVVALGIIDFIWALIVFKSATMYF